MDKHLQRQVDRLTGSLKLLLSEHERLHELIKRKRDAIAGANHRMVSDCCERENVHLRTISALEKQRLELVAEITLALDPAAAQPLRLEALAMQLPEPARGHLLVLRHELKQRMTAIQADTAVARGATETLAKHMRGLVQTVTTATSAAAGVYGRSGAPAARPMNLSTFTATA